MEGLNRWRQEMRCPALDSNDEVCGWYAEYQIDGGVFCKNHARRKMKERDAARA